MFIISDYHFIELASSKKDKVELPLQLEKAFHVALQTCLPLF
jgi:hypothetical protein